MYEDQPDETTPYLNQEKLRQEYQQLTRMLLLLLAISLASLGSTFLAMHIH